MHTLAVDEITDLKKAILKVHIFEAINFPTIRYYRTYVMMTDSLAEYNGIYDSFRSTYIFLLSHYNDRDPNIFTIAS